MRTETTYLDVYDENGLFSSFEDLGFCWRRILTTTVPEQAQELAEVLAEVLDKDKIEISTDTRKIKYSETDREEY